AENRNREEKQAESSDRQLEETKENEAAAAVLVGGGRRVGHTELLDWRPMDRVVGTADDDRLVGVALEEGENHFLADPGNRHETRLLCVVKRADADPARGVRIVLSVSIPMELHLHAAILVGNDLLPSRSDNHRRLLPD